MPKLPDALGTPDQLGAVPPDPSRIIPHYEAGQVGAAMQGFARDLGQSVSQIQPSYRARMPKLRCWKRP